MSVLDFERARCFIRMSMNNLKDIHNNRKLKDMAIDVVLSGCQWTIWRIYTTVRRKYTRKNRCFIRMSMNNLKDIHNKVSLVTTPANVVLSGCQWTIWRIYTTSKIRYIVFYCCFIRMSMNNLKDIHNVSLTIYLYPLVVLSGFQWTIWRIYTTLSVP